MTFKLDLNYKCDKCKNIFRLPVAFKNNAGNFCQSCKNEIHMKARQSQNERFKMLDGTCKYCGDKRINEKDWQDKTVCNKCISWRDYSLKLVRHSGKAFEHINKVEARETEEREKRDIEKQEKEMQKDVSSEVKTPELSRLDRLEKLMMKMASEYGIEI